MVGREFGRVSHDAALREDAERTDGLHSGNLRHRLFHSEGRQGTDRVERAQRGRLHKDHAGTADSKLGDHILAPADGRRPDRELRKGIPHSGSSATSTQTATGRRHCRGEIGDYIVVARRAKDRYFLGAGTDEKARTLVQKLDFLEPGVTYTATIYADAPGCGAQSGGIPDREAGGDGTRYHTHRDG